MQSSHIRPPTPDTPGRDEKGPAALPDAGLDWCCESRHPCRSSNPLPGSVSAGLAGRWSGAFRPRGDATLQVQTKTLRSRSTESRLSHRYSGGS